jgi:hypothetical protein
MDILKKIRPTKLKQVIGNRIQINRFLEVLKNGAFLQKIVVLIGPDGCGKSLISQLACEELGFHTLHVQNEYHSIKELPQLLHTFITNKTISCFFNQKRKVILFDNIDIFFHTDRNVLGIIDELYDTLVKFNVFMIITCKSTEEKKLLDAFKGKTEAIKINYPSIKDTFVYLSSCCDLGVDDDRILELTTQYKGSIRDIVLNLHLKDDELSDNVTFKDMTSFEITKKLFRRSHKMSEIMTLLHDDVQVVSYLLYENFPDEVGTNFDAKKNLLSLCNAMNRTFAIASSMEEFMYTHTDWSLYELILLLRIHGTNVLLKDVSRKNTTKDLKYRFSQMLSKISHRNILNKRIKNVIKLNQDLDIMECMMLTEIISKDKEVNTNVSSKKKTFDADECNLINTYQKYFEA